MGKRRKKKGDATKLKLVNFKAQLTSLKQEVDYLGYARSITPRSRFSDIVDIVKRTPLGVSRYGAPFPKLIEDLYKNPTSKVIPLEDEFYWGQCLLCNYKDELNRFVEMSNKFQNQFMVGLLEECTSTLDKIEEQFGYSFWLIKNRLALLQYHSGLEKHKEYTKKIVEHTCKNGILRFAVHHLSVSIEPATSYDKHYDEMQNVIEKSVRSPLLHAFFEHHLLMKQNSSEQELILLLRIESSNTIIDYYESLIRVAQVATAFNYGQILKPALETLRSLHVEDTRFHNLDWIKKGGKQNASDIVAPFTAFIKCDYHTAYNSAMDLLKLYPTSAYLIEIASRSAAAGEIVTEESIVPMLSIIHNLKKVMMLDHDSDANAKLLFHLGVSFISHGWAYYIMALVSRQLSEIPNDNPGRYLLLGVVSSNIIVPYFLRYAFDTSFANRYESLTDSLSSSIKEWTLCTLPTRKCVSCACKSLELKYGCALKMLANDEIVSAAHIAEELAECPNTYYATRGKRVLAWCLLKLGLIIDCVSYISTAVSSRREMHKTMPIQRVMALLSKKMLLDYRKLLCLPIFHDIYFRYYDHSVEHQRRYCFEDCISANNLSKPSEIPLQSSVHDSCEAIYFLKFLCTQQVMDLLFHSSEAVMRERADVCKVLAEIDSENLEEYQSEIKAIYKEIAIKNKIVEVEKTKIYVDVVNIKVLAQKELKDKFERLKSYLQDGLNSEDFDYVYKVRNHIVKNDAVSLFDIRAPRNEMTTLATSLVFGLRELFINNPQFGLDTYLCVRIRHGALSSKLRGPLEFENIITRTDGASGGYLENLFWINKLQLQDRILREHFNKAFATFSAEYDNLIQIIKDNWIHVKTDKSGNGLFDMTLYEPHLAMAISSIHSETTFEQFIDSILVMFFELLEVSLEHIRTQLRTTAKTKATKLLDVTCPQKLYHLLC